MNIKIGDFVKGITDDYGITNTKMTRGVVTNVCERSITVRVLDHDAGETVTDAKILFFYAPALVSSAWHESQTYICTIGGHRFFGEAGE